MEFLLAQLEAHQYLHATNLQYRRNVLGDRKEYEPVDLTNDNERNQFEYRMFAVHAVHRDYQKGIRAYVDKIDDFPKPRKDMNKDPPVPKVIKDAEWIKHLTVVHAYLEVPQCLYKMIAVKGREREYIAEVTARTGLVYQDVMLTVPEITSPSVVDQT